MRSFPPHRSSHRVVTPVLWLAVVLCTAACAGRGTATMAPVATRTDQPVVAAPDCVHGAIARDSQARCELRSPRFDGARAAALDLHRPTGHDADALRRAQLQLNPELHDPWR